VVSRPNIPLREIKLKCTSTDSASPYCAIYTLLELSLTHYICDTTPEIFSLDVTPTAGGSGSGFLASTTGSFKVSPPSTVGNVQSTSTTPKASVSTVAISTVTVQPSSSKANAVPTYKAGVIEVVAAAAMAILNIL
jgi:hypothetical protein